MFTRPALHVFLCVCMVAAAAPLQAAGQEFDRASIARLAALRGPAVQVLEGFPAGPTGTATVAFRRVDVYAEGARIYQVTDAGTTPVPRSDRIFLRGYSADRGVRIALSLHADGTFADGNGSGPEGAFAIRAQVDAAGIHRFSAIRLEDVPPPGYRYEYRCGNDDLQSPNPTYPAEDSRLERSPATLAATGSSPSPYLLAVVAIDTDSLFMSELFVDSTTNAANWIAKLFNTMNTMYEADLGVQLVQGTTFLRIGSDPYGAANHVPVDTADIDVFAGYWKTNYAGVQRAFATLLSGRGPCNSCGQNCISCSSSGRAWINQYCKAGTVDQQGHTVGSYSVEQVFSNILVDPNGDISSRLVGHELGHNFGADHTHCTDKTTAQTPVASNTIDQCYSGESSRGCYAGANSCPAGGAGTIMSYCNISGCGTTNLLQFDTTQADITLSPKITAAAPACLLTDRVFLGAFE